MGATLLSSDHGALHELLAEWAEHTASPALVAEARALPAVDPTAPGGPWAGDPEAITGKWSIRKVRRVGTRCVG